MKRKALVNPLTKAVNNLHGWVAVGRALGITKQAVKGWEANGSTPIEYMRALSAASGVPLEEFLEYAEVRRGVVLGSVVKALKDSAEDHTFTD